MRNAAESGKKRARDTARDKRGREIFASFSNIGVAQVVDTQRGRCMSRGVKGWKGGANHNRLCPLFSALCFYAFSHSTVAICSFRNGCVPRLGPELARFLSFNPPVFWDVDELNAKETARYGGSIEITNACARWMLFLMMKEVPVPLKREDLRQWCLWYCSWKSTSTKRRTGRNIKNVCGISTVPWRIYEYQNRFRLHVILLKYEILKNVVTKTLSHSFKKEDSLKIICALHLQIICIAIYYLYITINFYIYIYLQRLFIL